MDIFGEGQKFWLVVFPSSILGVFLILLGLLKRANEFLYENKLGVKRFSLPPGDLGWPMIGNMWSFLRAFKSKDPEHFINSFVKRFGRTGIYKAFMYGNPTILITVPELCKQVLMDDERFKPGWPQATMDLAGRKSFIGLSYEEHKRLRKLTAAPITGHRALSLYLEYIEDLVVSALEKWSNLGDFELLPQLRKLTFKVIMHIFLSGESEHLMEDIEKEYTKLNNGLRAMKINVPGFAFYNAFKARKRLVVTFQSIVNERKRMRDKCGVSTRKDMMDELLDLEDENGIKLNDEEIIDILLMYLNAGHESSGHITMWATVLLQQHPDIFQKAKAEQEEIVQNRPPEQKGLVLREVRQMEYLSKVIDETMRLINFTVTVFREAKEDVNMNGYLIPKGWKVNIWLRSVHLDPENYPDPKTFDPSRFDGPKPGTYLVFGAGGRFCPGKDLAKLEISVFLHYFLLNYRLERLNPKCPTQYLPHSRPTDNCLARITKN